MLPKMISRRLFNAALPLAISATSIDRISIGAVSSPWIPADATTLCSTSPSAPCGSKRTMPSPSQAHFTPVGNLPSVSAGFFPSMTKSRKLANMAGSALEIIDGTQLQNASQCVERSTRFIEQFQIGKIARCDAVTIVRVDPGIELREERVVHPDARIHCNTTRNRKHAGPPPFFMLSRRSKTSTSSMEVERVCKESRYFATRAFSRHSCGTTSTCRPSGRVSNWLLNRYED